MDGKRVVQITCGDDWNLVLGMLQLSSANFRLAVVSVALALVCSLFCLVALHHLCYPPSLILLQNTRTVLRTRGVEAATAVLGSTMQVTGAKRLPRKFSDFLTAC